MRKKYGSSHPVSKQIINSVSELSCLFLTEGGKHTIYYVIRFIDNDFYYIRALSFNWANVTLSNQDITSLKSNFILLHILGKKYIDPNKLRFGSLRFILFTILQCERLVCFHGPSIFYYW